jgi:steroid 5-alpha reductase family enzyme
MDNMWTPLTAVTASLVCASVVMLLMWVLQLRTGNAGVVDAAWALSIGALVACASALGHGWFERRLAIAVVMGLWSARLGTYLLRDRVIGKPEDGRYLALRREWGAAVRVRMLWFFEVQAMAVVFFSLPAFIVAGNPTPGFSVLEVLALLLWCAAFAGEVIADRQLARFKSAATNRGRICQVGLWRYSRHPNYFCEWVMWLAYALFALPSPLGAVALLCPAAMLYLLLRVTGVPLAEQQSLRSRGDAYRRYQKTTNAFFPWRPRT